MMKCRLFSALLLLFNGGGLFRPAGSVTGDLADQVLRKRGVWERFLYRPQQ